MRGAFPGFADPLTPDELADLATEPEVHSRLVLERGGQRPWEVVPGPQDPARLRDLPPSHWTLLVESADAHVPALADLLDAFAFLPRWRVDDVMVSFAAPRGTVGPHVDRYDVFLLQGRGRRLWQVDRHAPKVEHAGLDLRILRSFHATAEWVLEPGDLLYLPPGLAHYGLALEPSLTYSVGFRAPATRDLLFGCLERLARRLESSVLYEDPDLRPPAEPGEIAASALARIATMVGKTWNDAMRVHSRTILGEILTEPRASMTDPPGRRLGPGDVRERLRGEGSFVRHPSSRAAFVKRGRGVELFVDGRVHPLLPSLARAAPLLTGPRRVPVVALAPLARRPTFLTLLAELVNAGSYAFEAARGRGRARRPGGRPSVGSPRATGSGSRAVRRSGGDGGRGGKRGA